MDNKALVVKIGSNVILSDKNTVDQGVLRDITRQLTEIKKAGYGVIVVSSGAAALGRETFPKDTSRSTPFMAAVGQARLMSYYHALFKEENEIVAQVLLTSDDFLKRERYNFIYEILSEFLNNGVVPIINENDAVTRGRWGFGDNDFLAAMTAVNVGADAVVFLTNVDGVYDRPPEEEGAQLLKEVEHIEGFPQKDMATVTSTFGKGGMTSKASAARLAASAGIHAYIVNGLVPGNLRGLILENRAVGTHFKPKREKLNQKKGWLFIGRLRPGKIIVDFGAASAMKTGSSLLAVGVRGARGDFQAQDIVSVFDVDGNAIGYGTVNYTSEELRAMKNIPREEIKNKHTREVIHRDNLTILK